MRILSKSLQQVQRNNSTIATVSSFFDRRTFRTLQNANFNPNINEKIRLLSTDEKRSDQSTESLIGKKSDLAFYFKKYGYFFPVYWISTYAMCGVGVYGGLVAYGMDPEIVMQNVEEFVGFSPFSYYGVTAEYGRVGVAFVLNEALEVIRFP
eukprot:CAMPEP_0178926172 /NCGR_PEP_ID=MMETSP0786-20121207/18364_1 /TAXON_ID=186022 /ORGANISM="Thalassionema frauenfeldii, Strain CCMP 1798" /LENGTH=151 /DNA_ID=CAMNT_0020601223 /DNA_START=9 /DNA_END=460 /DNA_ORIENTATION=+